MSVFDRRHRWGPAERDGIMLSRTCRVCGLTNTVETLIPDAVIDAIVVNMRPNIYRNIYRTLHG